MGISVYEGTDVNDAGAGFKNGSNGSREVGGAGCRGAGDEKEEAEEDKQTEAEVHTESEEKEEESDDKQEEESKIGPCMALQLWEILLSHSRGSEKFPSSMPAVGERKEEACDGKKGRISDLFLTIPGGGESVRVGAGVDDGVVGCVWV